jgi:hypothetical protein
MYFALMKSLQVIEWLIFSLQKKKLISLFLENIIFVLLFLYEMPQFNFRFLVDTLVGMGG